MKIDGHIKRARALVRLGVRKCLIIHDTLNADIGAATIGSVLPYAEQSNCG